MEMKAFGPVDAPFDLDDQELARWAAEHMEYKSVKRLPTGLLLLQSDFTRLEVKYYPKSRGSGYRDVVQLFHQVFGSQFSARERFLQLFPLDPPAILAELGIKPRPIDPLVSPASVHPFYNRSLTQTWHFVHEGSFYEAALDESSHDRISLHLIAWTPRPRPTPIGLSLFYHPVIHHHAPLAHRDQMRAAYELLTWGRLDELRMQEAL